LLHINGSSNIIGLQNSQGATTFYRPDLHDELKRLCLLKSSAHKSPRLLLGSEVVSVVSAPLHANGFCFSDLSRTSKEQPSPSLTALLSPATCSLEQTANGSAASFLPSPSSSLEADHEPVNHKSSLQRSRQIASSTIPHLPRHCANRNAY
jgi:hypothetical protein